MRRHYVVHNRRPAALEFAAVLVVGVIAASLFVVAAALARYMALFLVTVMLTVVCGTAVAALAILRPRVPLTRRSEVYWRATQGVQGRTAAVGREQYVPPMPGATAPALDNGNDVARTLGPEAQQVIAQHRSQDD